MILPNDCCLLVSICGELIEMLLIKCDQIEPDQILIETDQI